MAARVAYLDTSALVKLVAAEPESAALLAALAAWPLHATGVVAEVELLRAVQRADTASSALARAREVLARLFLLELDASIRSAAAAVSPAGLRSLDAIHLASARSLGRELGAFVVYDRRLAAAAGAAGLPVLSPA